MSEAEIILPVVVVILGVLVIAVAMNRHRREMHALAVEEQSRKRVLAEFAAIRQHRPHHLVGVSKWIMDQHDR